MKFRVVLQLESKCLFIKGVKFDYFEVCIESFYCVTIFCIKNLSGDNFFNRD